MRILRSGERRREHCAERNTHWHDVIVCHPLAQIEQRPADGGLGVGRLENRLWLALERTRVAQSHTDSDLALVAKWDDDARSHDNRIGEPLFYCVCEILEQREGECDLDELWRLLTHFGMPC